MQRTYQLSLHGAVHPSEKTYERIRAQGRARRFADGEFIQHQGDEPDGLWVVVSGQVMSGRYGVDGGLTVFGVYGSGDLFGELSYLGRIPRLADAVADGPVELVWLDDAACRSMIGSDVDFTMLLLHSLASQLRIATERIDIDRQVRPEIRLARSLLAMVVPDDGKVTATHQHLADLIGVSRVTLGSVVKRLEQAGLVEGHYGEITILDRQKLENWVAANAQAA